MVRRKAMVKILTAKTEDARNALLIEMWRRDLPLECRVEGCSGVEPGGKVDENVAIHLSSIKVEK